MKGMKDIGKVAAPKAKKIDQTPEANVRPKLKTNANRLRKKITSRTPQITPPTLKITPPTPKEAAPPRCSGFDAVTMIEKSDAVTMIDVMIELGLPQPNVLPSVWPSAPAIDVGSGANDFDFPRRWQPPHSLPLEFFMGIHASDLMAQERMRSRRRQELEKEEWESMVPLHRWKQKLSAPESEKLSNPRRRLPDFPPPPSPQTLMMDCSRCGKDVCVKNYEHCERCLK